MNDPWVVALLRGRWIESVLAVVAVVAVTWPLGGLVADRTWTAPLVGTLLLVVVVGSLVRMVRGPRWLVLLAQVLALLSALAWWAQDHRADESALVAASALLHEGVATIQQYSVPAPATDGLTFFVLTAMALLALLVEALGVTWRAAAVAGVPLLLVSAGTASSSGQALEPWYFLVAAGAWLVLLTRQGRSVLEDWRAAGASSAATTVDRAAAAHGSSRRFGLTARVMGLSALVLAVAVPGLLPHLPTTVLLDRSGENASGSVSFTETLDLAQDLADRSNAPVIRYRTEDSSPPPLRVTASSTYADGSWQPADHGASFPMDQGEVMTINSMLLEAHELEATTETLTVTQNGMSAPQLAIPHPTSSVGLGQTGWRWDPLTDVALVDAAPSSYEVAYTEVAPLATLPEEIGAPPELLLDRHPVEDTQEFDNGAAYRYSRDGQLLEILRPDGGREQTMSDGTMRVVEPDGAVRRTVYNQDGTDPLAVDPVAEARVRELARELAGDHTNQIDVANEFQRYLRGPEFSYSLTLADPVEGEDGQLLDPISHFLETKQGYCTQFATAMVMLARAEGIPARLAIGFLPGSQGLDGTHTVVAADAHAWPELFIGGLGWTRFEPTPGTRSGTAPVYSTAGQEEEVPTAAPEPTVADPTVDPGVPDSAAEQGRREEAGWFSRNAETLALAGLGLATAALVLAVVPLAALWRRTRLRRGKDAAAQIEGEWAVLTSGLADLDVSSPRTATPRMLRDHYAAELRPDPSTRDALARATDRLESARYTAHTPPLGTMREDVRRVLEWRRGQLPRHRRLVAALLPASGRAQLRSLLPGGRRPADLAPVGY